MIRMRLDTQEFAGACPNDGCHLALPPLSDVVHPFFRDGHVKCAGCGGEIDVWETVSNYVGNDMPGSWVANAIGARRGFFDLELAPNTQMKVDLERCGMPPNAILLSLNLTGVTPKEGPAVHPIIMTGNESRARLLGNQITVYGVPATRNPDEDAPPDAKPARVMCSAVWAEVGDDAEPWLYVLDALEAASVWITTSAPKAKLDDQGKALREHAEAMQVRRTIIPAYAGFEIALTRLIRDDLEQRLSKSAVQSFLRDTRSASMLKILIPEYCSRRNLPALHEGIQAEILTLRSARNEIMHEGQKTKHSPAKARKMLAAAVMGIHYIEFLRRETLAPGRG